MLTKDQILSASDLPTEEVQVPEWGGSVFVRTMNGTERDAFEQDIIAARARDAEQNEASDGVPNAAKSNSELVNIRARLAVKTVVDAQGNRLFTDNDAAALGKKSGKALDRIFDVAQRLSGIGEKDVKELEGNSNAVPSGASILL